MKLLQELATLIEEAVQPIELTTYKSTDIPHQAWPQHVTYRGLNVFDVIYDNRPAPLKLAEKQLMAKDSEYKHVDMQEVYLAYDAKSDTFTHGYDGWATMEVDDDGNTEDTNLSPFITFKVSPKGEVTVVKKGLHMAPEGEMWYGAKGGRKVFVRKNPGAVEIRLD